MNKLSQILSDILSAKYDCKVVIRFEARQEADTPTANVDEKWRLDADVWLVVKDTPDSMMLIHRHMDNVSRIVPKGDAND